MSESKLDKLRELIRGYRTCLVAYSGGVDSAFLARVTHEELKDGSLAVIADSPSLPRRELQDALALARQFAFPVLVVKTGEFGNTEYLANPVNRCFHCKHELFAVLEPLARQGGFQVIAYGENASDAGDVRPGAQAAIQFQVRAPLKEAGLTKAEIRMFSARLGLPTAEKPQMACLSSRIPYGERVTEEKLRMIEEAENLLRDLGFYDVRVRHHEMGSPKAVLSRETEGSASPVSTGLTSSSEVPEAVRYLARIEVGPEELKRFISGDLVTKAAAGLKALGYRHVTLDLEGYRRGDLNL